MPPLFRENDQLILFFGVQEVLSTDACVKRS
jgi:hypothetical protein